MTPWRYQRTGVGIHEGRLLLGAVQPPPDERGTGTPEVKRFRYFSSDLPFLKLTTEPI